jgi:ABC-type branched-subunit amino acid transport system ATPase component
LSRTAKQDLNAARVGYGKLIRRGFQITRLARRLSVMDNFLLAAAGAKQAISRFLREIKSAGSSGMPRELNR